MLTAILVLGILGLVIGVGLAAASKIFYVYVDPLVLEIDDALPGANCGGCGMPGCTANAEAIVAGKASPNSCVAGGAELAEVIAGILGVSVSATEPDIAKPGCYYGVQDAETKFVYEGIQDCRAAAMINGGMKECTVGCLGLGSCVKACPFGALVMGEDGLPQVIQENCTGCGTCERTCPKGIINMSSVTRRIMKEYTTNDCTTPCQRACPAGINIRGYVGLIAEEKFEDAVLVIKERNPFPAVIGRICPHPCETECRRNLVDEAVAINYCKRFAADYEMQSGKRILPYKAPETGKRVAVAGGGIQGLTSAFFLARLGHAPTVLEATETLGGLLRTAIPENRLSQKVFDWEIQGILDMGVDAHMNMAMGRDTSVAELLAEGYDAVLATPGGWDGRLSRPEDKEPKQVLPNTSLLIDVAKDVNSVTWGRSAVFVGGGAAVLNIAAQTKAKEKILVLRGPADDSLTSLAKEKGVKLIAGSAITRLVGEGDTLKQVEVMNLSKGEKRLVSCSNLVLGSGRAPEMVFTRKPLESKDAEPSTDGPVEWIGVPPYKKPKDNFAPGLLSPADPVSDYSAAVEAIGAGRRAAASVHMVMNGEDAFLPENVITPSVYVQDVYMLEAVPAIPREIMPLQQTGTEDAPELEKGYPQEQAVAEASRCLQCGLICYQKDKAA